MARANSATPQTRGDAGPAMTDNPAIEPLTGGVMHSLDDLRSALRQFAAERDWEQFHSPKNLAMALSVEAAELLEHFQWLTEAESNALPEPERDAVADEIADVLLYLLRLSDRLGIDPVAAAVGKMAKNARKYPVATARGTARKYTRLPGASDP